MGFFFSSCQLLSIYVSTEHYMYLGTVACKRAQHVRSRFGEWSLVVMPGGLMICSCDMGNLQHHPYSVTNAPTPEGASKNSYRGEGKSHLGTMGCLYT